MGTVFRGKSKSSWVVIGGLALLLGSTTPMLAQRPRNENPRNENRANRQEQRQARREGHHAGDWLRRYKDVPPDQQQKALQNDPQFRNLPPERQQQLQQRLQRFNNLPPQQQQRILDRMETWEHLTPQQKDQSRQLFSQLRDLPPERRQRMQTAINDLRALPPEQRQQALDSPRYKNQFTPQERGLLGGISQLPLAPAETGPGDQGADEQ
jgi:hypothetical protein